MDNPQEAYNNRTFLSKQAFTLANIENIPQKKLNHNQEGESAISSMGF